MRKIILLCLLFCLTPFVLLAQKTEDVLGVETVEFNGITFELGWSQHNNTQFIQEYFPKGQTPESFVDMFTVYVIAGTQATPKQAVDAKEIELTERKGKDVFNWQRYNNDDGTEHMIDFLCYAGDEEGLDLVEFDVHRYSAFEFDGRPSLLLVFYTHRVNGDDIMPFLEKEFKDFRQKAVLELTKFDVKCERKKE